MKKENKDDQQDLLNATASIGTGAARRAAQQALIYFHNINQDTRSETQLFFTIIGAILGLTSGAVSLAAGISSRTQQTERVRLQISIRNLTRFMMTIIDGHGSNSRAAPSPAVQPGEKINYIHTIGNSLQNNGQNMLTLALVPVNESSRGMVFITLAITDNGSHIRVSRVGFSSLILNDSAPNQNPQNINNVFYQGNVHNIQMTVIPSTLTNGVDGSLDISILSPS